MSRTDSRGAWLRLNLSRTCQTHEVAASRSFRAIRSDKAVLAGRPIGVNSVIGGMWLDGGLNGSWKTPEESAGDRPRQTGPLHEG